MLRIIYKNSIINEVYGENQSIAVILRSLASQFGIDESKQSIELRHMQDEKMGFLHKDKTLSDYNITYFQPLELCVFEKKAHEERRQ